MTRNTYKEMAKLSSEIYNPGKSVPAAINNILVSDKDYTDETFPCGLTIKQPKNAIDRTNAIARKLINAVDNENLQKFNQYKNIINNILTFINNYDVLYVQTTNNAYKTIGRNPELIKQFVNDAQELDNQINSVIPELIHPISMITNKMKLDNVLESKIETEHDFYKIILSFYRTKLGEIFRYITIGEKVF